MANKINYGFIKSNPNDKDLILDNIIKGKSSLPMPKEFDYWDMVHGIKVKDQGSNSTCVPHCIQYIVEILGEMHNMNKTVSIEDIYSVRRDKKANGMQINDALSFVKNKLKLITSFGKVMSTEYIKKCLFTNGPMIFALPVRNQTAKDFWDGDETLGYHAITCTGFNKEGFKLLNSWGTSWGNKGRTILPYEDYPSQIIESYGILT